jgi:hypothetical protein
MEDEGKSQGARREISEQVLPIKLCHLVMSNQPSENSNCDAPMPNGIHHLDR